MKKRGPPKATKSTLRPTSRQRQGEKRPLEMEAEIDCTGAAHRSQEEAGPTELQAADETVRFRARLLDAAGASIIATDPAGKIIYMNQFAAMLFGWPGVEALGADIMDLTVSSTSRQQAEKIMEALRRGETWEGDFIVQRRDGANFPIRVSNTPLFGDAGELVAIIGVARDMSDRKAKEEALRESEERFHATFEQAAVGICQISFDGTFERANARLCEMFGYGRNELLSLKFSDITDPDDLPRSLSLIGELSEGKRESFAVEKRYIRKDGKRIWARSTVSVMRNSGGQPQHFIAIVEDITAQETAKQERRQAEHALRESETQLRALAHRLITAREDEATRIAREIHDQMGQALTALKLDVAALELDLGGRDWCTEDGALAKRIATMSATIESALQTSVKLCTELRPAVLDHLGLVAAIEWAARDFEARTGIFCNLDLPERQSVMESTRATAMFRIFQEILTNIIRHAEATEVSIRLNGSEDPLRLEVSDNGRGFGPDKPAAELGLGIIGMRERASAVRGNVEFSETIGAGTTVVVEIPDR